MNIKYKLNNQIIIINMLITPINNLIPDTSSIYEHSFGHVKLPVA